MGGTIAPFPKHQFSDGSGNPLAGALLFSYEAGTSTKLATYSDEGLTSANANPIVLDAAGRATIFLSPASYKFVLEPSTANGGTDPPTNAIWTVDEVSATPSFSVALDVDGTAGEALSALDVVYLDDGSGGTAGKWYKADADNAYSSSTAGIIGIAPSSVAQDASGSVRVGGRITGLAGLTIGDAYYVSATAGSLTNSAPANARVVGVADSATSLVFSPVEAGGFTAGPLPAISGASLTGVDKYLGSVIATVGNVGAGEDTLKSLTLAAGKLATDGEAIRATFWGDTANNANTKDIQIRIDDTAVDTSILDTGLTVSQAGEWIAGCLVVRTGATTGRATAYVNDFTSNSDITKSVAKVTSSFTCTWANAVEIRLTGEATSNDDISVQGGSIGLVSV